MEENRHIRFCLMVAVFANDFSLFMFAYHMTTNHDGARRVFVLLYSSSRRLQ